MSGEGIKLGAVDGKGLKIGITVTKWNPSIINQLQERCLQALSDSGVAKEDIYIQQVPGSFELPFAAKSLIENNGVDAVVCLGVLIKGETAHFEYISQAMSTGIMKLGLDSGKPIIFGVLTCFSQEQADMRAKKDGKDHGYEWGISAIEMARISRVSS